jgi:hypothetical protein
MDMSKYGGAAFLKFDDVVSAPRRAKVVSVEIGAFDKPVLEFESGEKLSLNATNVRTLCKHFGQDSRGWAGITIEVFAGETEFKGVKQNSALVRPVTLSDDIPF